MIAIEELSRAGLVALSSLLGCDYCQGGVPGIGKKLALHLLRAWKHNKSDDLLERFCEWSSPQAQEGTYKVYPLQLTQTDVVIESGELLSDTLEGNVHSTSRGNNVVV